MIFKFFFKTNPVNQKSYILWQQKGTDWVVSIFSSSSLMPSLFHFSSIKINSEFAQWKSRWLMGALRPANQHTLNLWLTLSASFIGRELEGPRKDSGIPQGDSGTVRDDDQSRVSLWERFWIKNRIFGAKNLWDRKKLIIIFQHITLAQSLLPTRLFLPKPELPKLQ